MSKKEGITFKEYLCYLREKYGLTKTDLAQELDVSLTYIIMIEKGQRKPPSIDAMESIADAINCSKKERNKLVRLGWVERDPKGYSNALKYSGASLKDEALLSPKPPDAITPAKMMRVPLLGSVPAGKPTLTEESVEAWYELPAEFIGTATEYLLKVKGDSMIGEGILPGMYVGVSKKVDIRNGDIVVINIDDEYTLKRYYEKDGIITLQSANKDVAPITIGPKQHSQIKYIAKVTWYGRRL